MDSETQRTTLDGQPIEYTVRESAAATRPRIDVDVREITVVVPEGLGLDPREMLADHAGWVLQKKAKFDRYRERAPDRVFEAGATFPYLGDPHELVVERRSFSEVVDGRFALANHHVEQTSIKRALETVYRRKARERFEDRADRFASEIGVTYDRIEVRNQRTKWGSCSSSGTLSLNWRLMMAPPEIVDYVVLHEVAHLRVHNHSDEFWELVSEYNPEYLEHAGWLEENSPKLIFTDADL